MKILKLGQMLGGSNSPGGAPYENLYSINYDGVDDYLTLGNSAELSPNSSGANRGYSLSIWVKSAASQYMFAYDSGKQFYLYVRWNGQPVMRFFGNNDANIWQQLNIDTSIADGDWHHLAFTYNLGSTNSSIVGYLDGVQKTNGSGATYTSNGTWSAITNNGNLHMGGNVAGGTYDVSFQDEFAIFDDVLTASQVTDIYNSGNTADLSSIPYLMGWWRMGDPTGTGAYPTIVDQSSNSNDGTMTNMVAGDITTDVP